MSASKTTASSGRPKDARVAQGAILDAAEEEFAKHGFAGARVDAIAAAAGYNKSLLFHYFDDKLGLYTAVLQRADREGRYLQDYVAEFLVEDQALTADRFRRFVERLVGASFDFYQAHPRLLRIVAWEEAEGWATLEKVVSHLDQGDLEQINAALARAQQAGVLRPNVSLSFILYAIYSLCRSYLTSQSLFRLIAPDQDVAGADLSAGRAQIVAFVVHGLIADAPGAEPGSATGGHGRG